MFQSWCGTVFFPSSKHYFHDKECKAMCYPPENRAKIVVGDRITDHGK